MGAKYTILELVSLRHDRKTNLQDVPYSFNIKSISNEIYEATPTETVSWQDNYHAPKSPLRIRRIHKTRAPSPFDLQHFPPGSRIIRIEPGMPIPRGAIPLPFHFEENYIPNDIPRMSSVYERNYSRARPRKLDLQASKEISLDLMAPLKTISLTKYDSLENRGNPLSWKGNHSHGNTLPEAGSLSSSDSSDYSIQIQLPVH
ncbi:hypothetical protein HYPBUDRAFT_241159 [Hyphopichia burtonii NRRL Y-1933]|uniref:Uncharacterized protein n=1 Tax=Hyphopichia burtonii NRRL Y-1933 TaxID=984485 RepID=A0A1E4RJ93_9ASCO|nr:hypothetical protein HYPBUDRAFT_241159 [Hyphopichia burtonii NRRL Y-1933]ODV67155.1 hypothetical protein HYPBUDRAFT_241159 [Hyphopichia burtonii NRRL Y-1933]